VKHKVPFHFKQTGANFKRGEQIYHIPRKDQQEQAAKAKIDSSPWISMDTEPSHSFLTHPVQP
jgi:hypothetical protein